MKRFLMLAIGLILVSMSCSAIAAVGWQEDFDPIKATWVETTASWNDLAGSTAILTENNPADSYGVTASETITLDLDQYSELVITSTAVDAGANYSVQIQEVGGAGAYADAVSWITVPGTQVVDIVALMGWSGTKSFVINVYIDGEGKSATFERFEVREPAAWVEDFDPIKTTWIETTASWNDLAGSKATLTENNPADSYGVAASENISVNLDIYSELVIISTAVDANSSYSVQIQEVGGAGAYADAASYIGEPGTQIVDIAELMGWSGTKSFVINVYISGEGKSSTFESIEIREPTGWVENFDPIKVSWTNDETYWTDTPGPNAILTEDSVDLNVRWWGAAYSEPITTDVNLYSRLYVKVSDVETGCKYTIQIEEVGGASATADAIKNSSAPGETVIDIAALMGWTGVKTFRINIWLDAGDGGRNVTFDKIEIGNNKAYGRPDPIFWQDHFDPMKAGWDAVFVSITDTPDSNMTITHNVAAPAYGKAESPPLTVNLDFYEELIVVVTDVNIVGVPTGGLDIAVQEQGAAAYTLNDVRITGPTTFKVNIPAKTGWSGYKTFTVALWINGFERSATFDLVKIAADCGTDVLLGDYCEDCIVDLCDIAEIGLSWMDSYDTTDLSDIADNWLVEYY